MDSVIVIVVVVGYSIFVSLPVDADSLEDFTYWPFFFLNPGSTLNMMCLIFLFFVFYIRVSWWACILSADSVSPNERVV